MKTPETKTLRILVVDDDVDVQRAVQRVATANGFEVVQALDGAAGLALATSESFDLVLLDINMPVMDGRDVLRKLRHHPVTARVPVLIYSGRVDQLDRIAGLALGADDYLDKPFAPEMLILKIRRLILKKASEDNGGLDG